MANQGNVDGQYCLETQCKHGRNEKKANGELDMIQCSLCHRWYHGDCVGVDVADSPALWPCPDCRMVSAYVKQLHGLISTLSVNMDHIRKKLDDTIEICNDVTIKCDVLSSENATLKDMVNEMKNEKINSDDDNISDDEDEEDDAEPSGTLLIGDSIIRCVKSTCEDLKVTAMSGSKICDIKETLKQINTKKEKYNEIYIVGGTNDCSTKKPANKIANEFRNMIRAVKDKAQNIHISSVLPRDDDKADMSKIDDLNQMLSDMANEESPDFKFIDNNVNFKYQNGSLDESLLVPIDKLHLSELGTKRLLQNLKLEDKAIPTHRNSSERKWTGKENSDISDPLPIPARAPDFKSKNTGKGFSNVGEIDLDRPIHFRGYKSSFSNFYESPITIWGMNFKTNEHAYNYRKAMEMERYSSADRIRKADTARGAQLTARREVVSNKHWKDIKMSVMYELLQHKVKQCATFRNDLISSRGRPLIEDTTHEYWGRGREGNGQNVLGRLLMTLRDTVIKSHASYSPQFPTSNYERNSLERKYDQQSQCYNCGENSHNVRTCRHSHPIKCHACHRQGHKQKHCSTRNY